MYQDSKFQPEIFQQDIAKVSALKLRWSLGINFQMINGVHNLTNDLRKQLFYAVGNTAVIYDYQNNSQRLLQGHCNQITATAYCRQKDILITADSGPDSMLVIWDANKGTPRKTIFQPHQNGIQTIDVTKDGRYIISCSKIKREYNYKKQDIKRDDKRQEFTLWQWNSQNQKKISSVITEKQVYTIIKNLKFNPSDIHQFAATGAQQVLFFSWTDNQKGFQWYCHEVPDNKKKQSFFTQTVFIPGITQAVSGTDNGLIIVWDVSIIMQDYNEPSQRKPIKIVHLMNTSSKGQKKKKQKGKKIFTGQKQKDPSINILKIVGQYLVIGSENGCIRFYDFQYRIIAWFQDIDIGSITTVSFSNQYSQSQQVQYSEGKKLFNKKEDKDQHFNCPDFIVVDDFAKVTLLKASLFQKIEKEQKKGVILMQSILKPIVATAVRPTNNTLAISCQNSVLYTWNFQQKSSSIIQVRNFGPQAIPTCLNYSPNSKFLSVGTKCGQIHILEVDKIQWSLLYVAQIQKAKPIITMQTFSPDSRHLATMDNTEGVALFSLQDRWQISGKIRVHHAPIRSIAFGQSLDQKSEIKLRLFSIAEDMKLAQYSVDPREPQKYKKLKLQSLFQVILFNYIQQQCCPTACIWYPINLYKQNVLLVVNQLYKIKLWNMMKDNTKFCKKTCLGPTYGGQINKLLVLNQIDQKNDYQDKYMAYATRQKVVGIIKLPLDGNPNNTMGLIAHPNKITGINSTVDGKLFFTSGSQDFCVNIWEVDFVALEQNFSMPPDYDPFPDLLEGGAQGQTIRDLKDFFYYSQIRSKDQHTTKARKLDGKVPLQAIPNMMRSMGYYPTQKQVQNMQNQIKYSKYLESFGQIVSELDLQVFLKLFVNHRPVYGISKEYIKSALDNLKKQEENKSIQQKKNDMEQKFSMNKQQFFQILMNQGQRMTIEQLQQTQKVLMGQGNEFPQTIDLQTLCHKILGFQDIDTNEQENEDIDEQQEYVQEN